MRIAAGLALLVSGAAYAETRTYPGAPPCDTTLQGCLDGAAVGDRIEIATPAPIDETVIVRRTLTLTGAAGVTPIIGGGPTVRTVRLQPDPVGASILLEGLTISNGRVAVGLNAGTPGSRVEVADCTVSNTSTSAVRIQALAPGEIIVRDSRLAGGVDSMVEIATGQDGGAVRVAILGNRVTAAALDVFGVNVDVRGSGNTTVDVKSNVIHDLQSTGIPIATYESIAATVNIVGNTIARAGRGIFVGVPGSTSTLAVRIFDNVIASTTGSGITVQDVVSSSLTIDAGFNDIFANGAPNDPMGYSLGAPLFTVDPLFVDAAGGDFRLKAGSLLIDNGTNTPPSGLTALDVDGNARVAGIAVDLGAHEFGSSPPTTTTTSTTSTTLPGCDQATTFVSARCRLGVLRADVQLHVPAGKLATWLDALVATASANAERAETLAAGGKTRAMRRATARAIRPLGRFVRKLGSRKAAPLDPLVRDVLTAEANTLRLLLSALRTASAQTSRDDLGLPTAGIP